MHRLAIKVPVAPMWCFEESKVSEQCSQTAFSGYFGWRRWPCLQVVVNHLPVPSIFPKGILLWMDKILHHLETMVETIVRWYLQGVESLRWVSERWCAMDFATTHGMVVLEQASQEEEGLRAPHAGLRRAGCGQPHR